LVSSASQSWKGGFLSMNLDSYIIVSLSKNGLYMSSSYWYCSQLHPIPSSITCMQ